MDPSSVNRFQALLTSGSIVKAWEGEVRREEMKERGEEKGYHLIVQEEDEKEERRRERE